nr:deleted in malignant brain tumors 1 protein-like [Lytechinus pictus]
MTVCGQVWDLRAARVVCRMVGYEGALDAPKSARFGQGSGDILVARCWGTEERLEDCFDIGIYSLCGHQWDGSAVCYSGGHPNPLEVRLAGTNNSAEGRVEVLHNGDWGTICDGLWDLRDARVVCRILGYDGALEAPRSARFGQGSRRILLDWVGCDGTEDNLAECAHRGISDWSYCGHTRDAGAICYSGANPNTVQVRLAGGLNDAEGRVEVLHDGSWGTICDDRWELRDARVVCRMLGYDGVLGAPGSARFGPGSGRILLTSIGCDGTEDNLADCAHAGFKRYSCSHARDAGAICYSEVRLADGASENEGRVEIIHDGSWGTVCDDLWDLEDATVVCRHLGFDGALAALPKASFGEGAGNIFLDDVQCNGSESNLKDCNHSGIGVHDCAHKEDASVICRTTVTVYKRMAAGNFDNDIYMEVTNLSSTSSTYQDLHAPPRLPDRQKTGVNSHEFESQIIIDFGGNYDADNLNKVQNIGEGDIHEYADMKTIHQTHERNEDMDGYCIPDTEMPSRDVKAIEDCDKTEMLKMSDDNAGIEFLPKGKNENMEHDYMDMKTVYQSPKSGEDLDLDGYLLPNGRRSLNNDDAVTYETTLEREFPIY